MPTRTAPGAPSDRQSGAGSELKAQKKKAPHGAGLSKGRGVVASYIMPPMSGMPPPGMAGASYSGSSATIASVLIIRPATEEAACRAVRVTLAGSRMPISSMSPYSPVAAL